METILVIAALAREFSGLAPLLSGRRRVSTELGYAEEGELAGRRWVLAANGMGRRMAVAAARSFPKPDRLVSTGYCGALDPGLDLSDVVICNRVIDADENRRFVTGDDFGATCLSGNRVIATAREKQLLRETTGASVVDMEAAGVGEVAQSMGVPFHCIKVVTDTAQEDLGLEFDSALKNDGKLSFSRLALSVLRQPQTRILELLALDKRSRAASARLGAYLGKHAF